MPAIERIPAVYWSARADGRVACELCPQRCVIPDGQRGLCRLRENRGGELWASGYGQLVAAHVDPIEKKPLYHFHPGADVLSVGPNGCNLRCRGCQNADISQESAPTDSVSPEALVRLARDNRSPGIAYTYTEPLIWFEYMRDACRAARAAGLYNVAVTNGYVEEAPARELAEWLDAANVDVKSLDESFYADYCGASLAPVLRTCEIFKRHLHLEVTYLLVTGLNDGEEAVTAFVRWVADHLGPDTPVHFSRYFPRYKMDAPATPVHHLLRAKELADRDLYYVYLGNIAGVGGNDTFCPRCAHLLIRREGYRADVVGVSGGKCAACGRPTEVVL